MTELNTAETARRTKMYETFIATKPWTLRSVINVTTITLILPASAVGGWVLLWPWSLWFCLFLVGLCVVAGFTLRTAESVFIARSESGPDTATPMLRRTFEFRLFWFGSVLVPALITVLVTVFVPCLGWSSVWLLPLSLFAAYMITGIISCVSPKDDVTVLSEIDPDGVRLNRRVISG